MPPPSHGAGHTHMTPICTSSGGTVTYFIGTDVRPNVAQSSGCSSVAGATLAMPKTQAEQDSMYAWLQANPPSGGSSYNGAPLYWLGGHLVSGVWQWDDGSSMPWTNWDS